MEVEVYKTVVVPCSIGVAVAIWKSTFVALCAVANIGTFELKAYVVRLIGEVRDTARVGVGALPPPPPPPPP